jgi:hypothetical protein
MDVKSLVQQILAEKIEQRLEELIPQEYTLEELLSKVHYWNDNKEENDDD